MSAEAERAARVKRLEEQWSRHLAGETVAGEELAEEIRAGGPPGQALVADEALHRMLAALGRGAADEQAFVDRVAAVTAAEASVEGFVRAVDARIDAPPRRRRVRWSLVFAPAALAAALIAVLWWRAPGEDRLPAPPMAGVNPSSPPTVVTGTLAAAGVRLGPGQDAPQGVAVDSDQGRACLRFGDGSRLCLERGTRVRLASDGRGQRVSLETGKTAALIPRRKAGPSFTIITPAAEVSGIGATAAFSVEVNQGGRSAIARVVRGTAAVLPRGARRQSGAVTVKAHQALSLASGSPWRISAEDERDEWSLIRGQTTSALLAASTSEPGRSTDRPEASAAAGMEADGPAALLELADALRARGRLQDAQGICDQLARRYPGRSDIARLAAELRAPPPPIPWNASTPAVYRINAGGGRYVDPRGNAWSADRYFQGGKTGEFWEEIDGTDMDPLYRSERVVFPDDRLSYNLPVPDGQYVVRLHFAEIWAGTMKPGMRRFDVLVEGENVLASYDIAADVGPMTATVKQVIASVRDGSLDIDFRHVVENPKISGIEVFALAAGAAAPPAPAPLAVYPPLPLPPTDALYRVNVGGREYVDPQGHRWQADDHFTDTGLGDAWNVEIAGTDLDPLYQTMRYACHQRRLTYHFPAPPGRYLLRLHFADIEPGSFAGNWMLGVQVEGVEVIKKLDVFGEAGPRRALIKEVDTVVDDGAIDVSLRAIKVCAQVAGIEVIPLE